MSDEFKDYIVDNVIDNQNKKSKRKKKSKDKGNRGELALCKILNDAFDTNQFSRVVGSGNRWSHVEHVVESYIGDIVCPTNFSFTIECKHGYDDIDITAFVFGSKKIDSFLEQAQKDADLTGKQPMVCWKRNYRDWIAIVPFKVLGCKNVKLFNYKAFYKKWVAVSLGELVGNEKLKGIFFT